MLRITIELLPAGDTNRARVLGVMHIWNKKLRDGFADYGVRMGTTDGEAAYAQAYEVQNPSGEVKKYPRWSANIWDLVARAINNTLKQKKSQNLGPYPRSVLEVVPVKTTPSGLHYVCFSDMPECVRPYFEKYMAHKTRPVVHEENDPLGCAYAWDWKSFIGA